MNAEHAYDKGHISDEALLAEGNTGSKDDVFTGVLPRRFRNWAFGVLTAASPVAIAYGASAGDVELWVALVLAVFGIGTGVATINTRGNVTRN